MHGRVAMLAALGFVVQEQLQDFPAFLNFDGVVTGAQPNTHDDTRVAGWHTAKSDLGIIDARHTAVSVGPNFAPVPCISLNDVAHIFFYWTEDRAS